MSLHDTLEQAFRRAGLDRHAAPTAGIRSVIDKALSAAGLGAAPVAPSSFRKTAVQAEASPLLPGRVTMATHTGPAGSRRYRLYVPSRPADGPRPLVLMLHGCKQDPADFAAGTRMDALAEQHGFLVAYPEQTARANGSNCWNWFEPAHQGRSGGEPDLLAGIVDDVVRGHGAAADRVFAAGLSAGAAMALILAESHPGRFAAVAAHSGLPVGSARDVPSAFAAMQGRGGGALRPLVHPVRTLVIHGDADGTVAPANGERVVGQAVAAHARSGRRLTPLTRSADAEAPAQVTRYLDAEGREQVTHWAVRGLGHAWAGGSPAGSFTDARGPDASAEVVRFFLEG